MQEIKKRLILTEDINFDVLGTNEKVSFGSDSQPQQGKKINAGDIPLKKASRQKLAAIDVDTALNNVYDKLNNFVGGGILESDIEVAFGTEDSLESIQLQIVNQPKDLNGRTMTFIFPEGISQLLFEPVVFEGFYNGTLIIAGADTSNRIKLYDRLDINNIFTIKKCFCNVYIENFEFIHQYSFYGVLAENSPAVHVENCVFYGMENQTSYALNYAASNGDYQNCVFNYDLPWIGNSIYTSGFRVNTEKSFFRDVDNSFLGLYGGTAPDKGAAIELHGQDSSTPETCNLNAETCNLNAETCNLNAETCNLNAETCNLNAETCTVNDKNIVRSVNGRVADAAGEIDAFFAPDLSAPVTLTPKQKYTAETNGFIHIIVHVTISGQGYGRILINKDDDKDTSKNEIHVHCDGFGYGNLLVPVKKGDTYIVVYSGTGGFDTKVFYPAR